MYAYWNLVPDISNLGLLWTPSLIELTLSFSGTEMDLSDNFTIEQFNYRNYRCTQCLSFNQQDWLKLWKQKSIERQNHNCQYRMIRDNMGNSNRGASADGKHIVQLGFLKGLLFHFGLICWHVVWVLFSHLPKTSWLHGPIGGDTAKMNRILFRK